MKFWLNEIPLSGVFLLTFIIVVLSIWVGEFTGTRRRQNPKHESEVPLGTIISAMLGLLALLLAFTFAVAAEIFQNRRQLLLNEVNAIGTAYLRTQTLPESNRTQISKLMKEYVDIRASLAKKEVSMGNIQEVISRSESIQDQIWSQAIAVAKADPYSEINALFIASLNELIDLHTSRVTVFQYRIPPVIWYALYFLTILSMLSVGYHAGLSGKSSIKIGIVLALTFSMVIFLIMDLDRPLEGHFRVGQKPLLELQQKMQLSARNVGAQTESAYTAPY